jgi:hypothetical protein
MAKRLNGLYISYNAILLVVVIAIFFIVLYLSYRDLIGRINLQQQQQQQPEINVQVLSPNSGSGDDRYTRAPKPERDWMVGPDYSSIRPSIYNLPTVATRGIPESYQQMGLIKTDDNNVLPLYGRPTASRSDRFQYYSRTDTYNPIQIPIRYNNRDCVDDIGCNELFDGDSVSLVPSGQKAQVTLYRLSGPTYVP